MREGVAHDGTGYAPTMQKSGWESEVSAEPDEVRRERRRRRAVGSWIQSCWLCLRQAVELAFWFVLDGWQAVAYGSDPVGAGVTVYQ